MSDEASTPSSKPTGSVILENPQVYDLLISKINERVNEGIRKRNESLRNWLVGILTLVVISVAAGGTLVLRGYVDDTVAPAAEEAVTSAVGEAVAPAVEEAVTSAVEKAVTPAVGEAVTPAVEKAVASAAKEFTDALRFDLEIGALNSRMLKLDLSEAFSEEEAVSIIEKIASLVSRGAKERLRELAFATDTAVKSFAAVNRLDLMIRLQNIVPDLFRDSGIITETMLQAIGFTLLADAGAPNSWTDTTGSRRELYKSYRTYADRAELAGYPELYLLHEMLLGYIEGRSAEEIGNLIADIDDLSEGDSAHFFRVMTSLASGGVTIEPTAQSGRVVSRVTAFLCEYKEQSDLLQRVFQQVALRCQAQNP